MQFKRRKTGRKELSAWLVLLGSLALAGILLTLLHLAGAQLCLFRKYTGYPCFLCGATRAVSQLFQGHFVRAFLLQPLATVLMTGVLVFTLLHSFQLIVLRMVFSVSLSRREKFKLFAFFCVLVLVNWVYLLIKK